MPNEKPKNEQTESDTEPIEESTPRAGDVRLIEAAKHSGRDDVMLTALVHGIEALTDQTKMLRHTVRTDFTLRKVRWVIAAFIAFFLLAQDVGGYIFYQQLVSIARTNQKSFERIDKATNPEAQATNAKATGNVVNHIILCADNHIDVVILRVPQRADCPDPTKP